MSLVRQAPFGVQGLKASISQYLIAKRSHIWHISKILNSTEKGFSDDLVTSGDALSDFFHIKM